LRRLGTAVSDRALHGGVGRPDQVRPSAGWRCAVRRVLDRMVMFVTQLAVVAFVVAQDGLKW
jgi:hypothetical protein